MENEEMMSQNLTPEQMLTQALLNEQMHEAQEPAEDQGTPQEMVEDAVEDVVEQVQEPVPPQLTREDIDASNANMLNQIAQMLAQKQEAEMQPQQEEVVEEVPDMTSEEFMDKFYDDPTGTVQKVANAIADKRVKEVVSEIRKELEPLMIQSEAAKKEGEMRSTIGDFLNNTGDAKEYFNEIAQYIRENQLDPTDSRSYLDAYRVSKLGRQDNELRQLRERQGKTLDDYMNDSESFNQILNNENVKKQIIENYLKELNGNGKPATIGAGSSNAASAQDVVSPKTLNEAKQMFIHQLSNY